MMIFQVGVDHISTYSLDMDTMDFYFVDRIHLKEAQSCTYSKFTCLTRVDRHTYGLMVGQKNKAQVYSIVLRTDNETDNQSQVSDGASTFQRQNSLLKKPEESVEQELRTPSKLSKTRLEKNHKRFSVDQSSNANFESSVKIFEQYFRKENENRDGQMLGKKVEIRLNQKSGLNLACNLSNIEIEQKRIEKAPQQSLKQNKNEILDPPPEYVDSPLLPETKKKKENNHEVSSDSHLSIVPTTGKANKQNPDKFDLRKRRRSSTQNDIPQMLGALQLASEQLDDSIKAAKPFDLEPPTHSSLFLRRLKIQESELSPLSPISVKAPQPEQQAKNPPVLEIDYSKQPLEKLAEDSDFRDNSKNSKDLFEGKSELPFRLRSRTGDGPDEKKKSKSTDPNSKQVDGDGDGE